MNGGNANCPLFTAAWTSSCRRSARARQAAEAWTWLRRRKWTSSSTAIASMGLTSVGSDLSSASARLVSRSSTVARKVIPRSKCPRWAADRRPAPGSTSVPGAHAASARSPPSRRGRPRSSSRRGGSDLRDELRGARDAVHPGATAARPGSSPALSCWNRLRDRGSTLAKGGDRAERHVSWPPGPGDVDLLELVGDQPPSALDLGDHLVRRDRRCRSG